jgi:hypothetical protein
VGDLNLVDFWEQRESDLERIGGQKRRRRAVEIKGIFREHFRRHVWLGELKRVGGSRIVLLFILLTLKSHYLH